jgi:hypothetical protein
MCDTAIFADVKSFVAKTKDICILDDFNNHFSCAGPDMHDSRLNCLLYGLNHDSKSCRNNIQHAQFF